MQAVRPEIPAEARQPCAAPVLLPDRAITQRETVSLWARDRAALRACEGKRAAAVVAVDGVAP